MNLNEAKELLEKHGYILSEDIDDIIYYGGISVLSGLLLVTLGIGGVGIYNTIQMSNEVDKTISKYDTEDMFEKLNPGKDSDLDIKGIYTSVLKYSTDHDLDTYAGTLQLMKAIKAHEKEIADQLENKINADGITSVVKSKQNGTPVTIITYKRIKSSNAGTPFMAQGMYHLGKGSLATGTMYMAVGNSINTSSKKIITKQIVIPLNGEISGNEYASEIGGIDLDNFEVTEAIKLLKSKNYLVY